MSQPFVGEIRVAGFNFAPVGWAFCDGQLMSIDQFATVFNLIGTTYGGDGQSTFALPDLQGRVVLHQGNDSLGNSYVMGQKGGVENVTVTNQQLPAHTHAFAVSNVDGTTNVPHNNYVAGAPLALGFTYGTGGTATAMGSDVIQSGGNQPHDNIQPFQAVTYIFSLTGIFPTQN